MAATQLHEPEQRARGPSDLLAPADVRMLWKSHAHTDSVALPEYGQEEALSKTLVELARVQASRLQAPPLPGFDRAAFDAQRCVHACKP